MLENGKFDPNFAPVFIERLIWIAAEHEDTFLTKLAAEVTDHLKTEQDNDPKWGKFTQNGGQWNITFKARPKRKAQDFFPH